MSWEPGELEAFVTARLGGEEKKARKLTRGGGPAIGTAGQWNAYVEGGGDGWAFEDDAAAGPGGIVGREDVAAHVVLYDPRRALREVAASRLLLDAYGRLLKNQEAHAAAVAEYRADVEHEERTGKWAGAGNPGSRSLALGRGGDYLGAVIPLLRTLTEAKAAVWSDHPKYKGER